jgi:hypothetical protein
MIVDYCDIQVYSFSFAQKLTEVSKKLLMKYSSLKFSFLLWKNIPKDMKKISDGQELKIPIPISDKQAESVFDSSTKKMGTF